MDSRCVYSFIDFSPMKIGLFLLFLLFPIVLCADPVPQIPKCTRDSHSNGECLITPHVENDKGARIIAHWKSLQVNNTMTYDTDACYGWIGPNYPRKGEYIGMALTPNCRIVVGDLLNFVNVYHQTTAEYDRYSTGDQFENERCGSMHMFILRLHQLDEGGMFTYHYSRVRMIGNKIQVTFFAKKDMLKEGGFYQMASASYEHPSVKLYSPQEFPISFKPFYLYSLDHEFLIWFRTREGLRLYNYRLTWDGTNVGNGYHIDVYKEYVIPNTIIPEERVAHIITSDKEVHYFFVKTDTENEHNVLILKHVDLMRGDFTRIQPLETKMTLDVTAKKGKARFNRGCSYVAVEFYRNQSIDANGKLVSDLPIITDPPLSLNIFATHFRSAYPFVQAGRRIPKPNYSLAPILLSLIAMGLARWTILGYEILPSSLARRIQLWRSSKYQPIFKKLANKRSSQFQRVYKLLYSFEKFILRACKSAFHAVAWVAPIETNDEDEECRESLQLVPHPSSKEATSTLLSDKDKRE